MIKKLSKSFFRGEVTPPPSKSFAHRLILASSLADKSTKIFNTSLSDDITATIECLNALGGKILVNADCYNVSPILSPINDSKINCGESGSTLRFLLPVISALGVSATINGKGRLTQRPMGELLSCLRKNGIEINDNMPFNIKGKLKAGNFEIRGDISSQFITGLMYALPLLQGDSKIILTSRLTSKGYIDITLSVLERYGIKITKTEYGYFVRGGQKYLSPKEVWVEGDWSNAAFWLVAGVTNGDIKIKGLERYSLQGDRKIFDILLEMGGEIIWEGEDLIAKKSSLKSITIDGEDIPDIVPILSVACSVAEGESKIKNAERLRIKECDRLAATIEILSKMGIQISYNGTLNIRDGEIYGAKLDGYNDHRMVMTGAILASLALSGDTVIKGYQAVNKSYPEFFDDYTRLGGIASDTK